MYNIYKKKKKKCVVVVMCWFSRRLWFSAMVQPNAIWFRSTYPQWANYCTVNFIQTMMEISLQTKIHCNFIHAYQQCSVSRKHHKLNRVLHRISEQNDNCTDIVVRRHKTCMEVQRFRMQWNQYHLVCWLQDSNLLTAIAMIQTRVYLATTMQKKKQTQAKTYYIHLSLIHLSF